MYHDLVWTETQKKKKKQQDLQEISVQGVACQTQLWVVLLCQQQKAQWWVLFSSLSLSLWAQKLAVCQAVSDTLGTAEQLLLKGKHTKLCCPVEKRSLPSLP